MRSLWAHATAGASLLGERNCVKPSHGISQEQATVARLGKSQSAVLALTPLRIVSTVLFVCPLTSRPIGLPGFPPKWVSLWAECHALLLIQSESGETMTFATQGCPSVPLGHPCSQGLIWRLA